MPAPLAFPPHTRSADDELEFADHAIRHHAPTLKPAIAAAIADDVRMTAEEAAQAVEDQEHQRIARLELSQAIWAPFMDAPVPDAGALGINVEGLTPARSELVRFAEWQKRQAVELQALEDQRGAFLKQMGVPVVTEQQLRKLEEQDRSGFMQWRRRGSPAKEKPELQAYQREQLQAKLASDQWAGQVASEELDRVEAEIETATKIVDVLGKRHATYLNAALAEAAAPIAVKIEALTAQLTNEYGKLMGLHLLTNSRLYNHFRDDLDHLMPSTAQDRRAPRIAVSRAIAAAQAVPWQRLEELWTTDPRAVPPEQAKD